MSIPPHRVSASGLCDFIYTTPCLHDTGFFIYISALIRVFLNLEYVNPLRFLKPNLTTEAPIFCRFCNGLV